MLDWQTGTRNGPSNGTYKMGGLRQNLEFCHNIRRSSVRKSFVVGMVSIQKVGMKINNSTIMDFHNFIHQENSLKWRENKIAPMLRSHRVTVH